MTTLDPFNSSDGGRTFTLPASVVGGETSAINPLASLGFGTARISSDLPEIRSGINPLVSAANHLLNLIPQIRSLRESGNPAALRDYLVQQIQPGANNGRGNLDDFKLLVQIELCPNVPRRKLELFDCHIAILLQYLG